jgi:GT2 family glycosyltransferase/2-polyprenyl-3-methyl-5-hydroxy-6-metoxy-1,4-benzoquinol methylase
MTENPTHVYWRQSACGQRSSLSVLRSFVKEQARVLDLGIGSGSLGRELHQHLQCRLDGVTINPQEQAVASGWYERIAVLDLDQGGWDLEFPQQAYDVIICADVLEHLKHPELVLSACHRLLHPDGVLLVSVPNVAYAGLIADLMRGNFDYGREGLMDSTHLRFFTRNSFRKLLASQGWEVEAVEPIEQPLHETEYSMAFDALPPSVGRHLLALPDADAYQLVFVARRPGQPALQRRPAPVQHFAAATFVAELFVASGNGFSPDRRLTGFGEIGAERQTLMFQLPASFGPWPALRLDPADRPGFFWLHRMTLRDAASAVVWEWVASESGVRQLAGASRHQLDVGAYDPAGGRLPLLLLGDDPSLELPIDSASAGRCAGQDCTLEIECGWPMSADYLAAANRFNDLQDRLRAQGERIDMLERAFSQQKMAGAVAAADGSAPAAPAQAAERPWTSRLAAIFNRPQREPVPELTSPAPAYDPTVEIVVPVYGNLKLVQRCVRSVLATTGTGSWHMTLIDDASPDPQVRAWLHDFARNHPGVTVLENARNLGFVQTVNLGMRLGGRRDVVLLNSDTEVANDWLDRLRATALGQQSVGTVTPFSNNATICSYPQFCVDNPLPPGQDTAGMDRLCAGSNRGRSVEIPTAVGFCMYIRRACLDQVGEFDAANFGKGYGEENDFCLRATALGWRHLHALDVFVYHEGGASFKESRAALQANALAAIRRLHPGYEELIREFVQKDPARPYREEIDQARSGA